MGGYRHQGLKVVADDFGGDVLEHCLLTQFEIEAVFEPFECFLDAPAIVVELAEAVGWKELGVEQIGHQHALLAIGQDVTDQANALRLARAFVVQRILFVRRVTW